MKNSGYLSLLRCVFPKDEDFERVIVHLSHSILKDGSRITCDCFTEKNFLSYITEDIVNSSLKSDTRYFHNLGNDNLKITFFKSFIEMMKKDKPNFGKGCYVDSTPLPNDIDDNHFNALCCHEVNSSEIMTRLVMVLDEETGLPVWYELIPGNVLDLNVVMKTINDVADTLDIEIDSLVLDAGYVSEELIKTFHIGSPKTIIGRMPARKGYPYKSLYWQIKNLINKGNYAFLRNHHTYFGYKKEITIFDQQMYAYIYVDHYNAMKKFSDYLATNEEEFENMPLKDKDWTMVRYGYFVLLSNINKEPR